jgi:hypothetical protein
LADRIWETGILGLAPADSNSPGLVDPVAGRFYEARRLSVMRGLWTDRPEALVERSAAIDISLLGPAVPFGLLPASDPLLLGCSEAILRHNVLADDPHVLVRWSADPANLDARQSTGHLHRQEVSSLATLWMARYLILLGRETGDGRHLNRALALLDGVLGRLGSLGLALLPSRSGDEEWTPPANSAPGVWGLYTMLSEAMLDLAGLDYDALSRRLLLEPALPPAWPSIGLSQPFRCGDVSYRLERPVGGARHRLSVKARLDVPVTLHVDLTCPGLTELGPWQATPDTPMPKFDRAIGRLSWIVELPTGHSEREWTWGPLDGARGAVTERGLVVRG